jgi:hypothetical protein
MVRKSLKIRCPSDGEYPTAPSFWLIPCRQTPAYLLREQIMPELSGPFHPRKSFRYLLSKDRF